MRTGLRWNLETSFPLPTMWLTTASAYLRTAHPSASTGPKEHSRVRALLQYPKRQPYPRRRPYPRGPCGHFLNVPATGRQGKARQGKARQGKARQRSHYRHIVRDDAAVDEGCSAGVHAHIVRPASRDHVAERLRNRRGVGSVHRLLLVLTKRDPANPQHPAVAQTNEQTQTNKHRQTNGEGARGWTCREPPRP